MDKVIFVIMAVFVFNVRAFVKRDAEAPTNTNSEVEIQRIKDMYKNIGAKIGESFNHEEIKKYFKTVFDEVHNSFKKLRSSYEAAKVKDAA